MFGFYFQTLLMYVTCAYFFLSFFHYGGVSCAQLLFSDISVDGLQIVWFRFLGVINGYP